MMSFSFLTTYQTRLYRYFPHSNSIVYCCSRITLLHVFRLASLHSFEVPFFKGLLILRFEFNAPSLSTLFAYRFAQTVLCPVEKFLWFCFIAFFARFHRITKLIPRSRCAPGTLQPSLIACATSFLSSLGGGGGGSAKYSPGISFSSSITTFGGFSRTDSTK